VVENKVARWVPKGFIVVSVNYRMLPKAGPLQQAADVAAALAAAQQAAVNWGGDSAKFILMGHSAGSHLVGLLTASPAMATQHGARPWLGSVLLDGAAFDVARIMQAPHPRLYDQAFGSDADHWRAASPLQVLTPQALPALAVCSSRRRESCRQAKAYAVKAVSLGASTQVLEEDLSHREINQQLGLEGRYTAAVETFMRRLDPAVARLLR
jgi:arylformamidase